MSSSENKALRTRVGRGEYVVDERRVADAIVRRRDEFVRDVRRSGVLVTAQLDLLSRGSQQNGSGARGDLA